MYLFRDTIPGFSETSLPVFNAQVLGWRYSTNHSTPNTANLQWFPVIVPLRSPFIARSESEGGSSRKSIVQRKKDARIHEAESSSFDGHLLQWGSYHCRGGSGTGEGGQSGEVVPASERPECKYRKAEERRCTEGDGNFKNFDGLRKEQDDQREEQRQGNRL
jgi:hypothetical protein